MLIAVTRQRYAGGPKVVREFQAMTEAEIFCMIQRSRGWRCGITGKARKPKSPALYRQRVQHSARGYPIRLEPF